MECKLKNGRVFEIAYKSRAAKKAYEARRRTAMDEAMAVFAKPVAVVPVAAQMDDVVVVHAESPDCSYCRPRIKTRAEMLIAENAAVASVVSRQGSVAAHYRRPGSR